MIFEDVYTLRVLYKSGQTIDFDVLEYEVSKTSFSWRAANFDFRPLNLNYDEVISIWRVGHRRRFKRKAK